MTWAKKAPLSDEFNKTSVCVIMDWFMSLWFTDGWFTGPFSEWELKLIGNDNWIAAVSELVTWNKSYQQEDNWEVINGN